MAKRKDVNTPSFSSGVTNHIIPRQSDTKEIGSLQEKVHNEVLAAVDFTKPAEEVARQLIGKKIKRVLQDGTTIEALITKVVAYTKEDNEKGKYKAILTGEPGDLIVTNTMGHLIMNIITQDSSCITLQSIQHNGKAIEGKGKVSKALEIKGIGKGQKVTGVNVTHPGAVLTIE